MNWQFTKKERKTVLNHTKMLIIIYNKRISFITLISQFFFHLVKMKSLIVHCDGENVGKQILSHVDSESVNCPMEDDLTILIKITKDIMFDPAIPLLGVHPIHGGN